MTDERPKRPSGDGVVTAADWARFLRARVEDEQQAANSASTDGWWELTEPGARRFGVQAGGRVIAPVLTGRGHWPDREVTLHIVRNQPGRTSDDLVAKLMLLNLLEHSEQTGNVLTNALLQAVQRFAAPFIGHPEHPEYVPPEGQ
ncbi:hypothetical protein J7I98_38965 [Streptomyces sp. ISL-98]|uniref:DUF6221 family protein n=1 Tax=Streptomyces sp. ISL-98 TaxID=2819192 RepID=UPI001BE8F62A|nr:DUF6221 family protein [Streptomyces sp. ISL-98]MBT2511660.1 hypothetical protein [Streptomyces sp. ISL-98]